MKLTPIEIERHTFRTVWRGYDPDEVSAFLGQIAHQLTQTLTEHQKVQENFKIQSQRLQQVDFYEDKLKDALLAANQFRESTQEDARRNAELLLKEAEVRADQILADGRSELRRIQEEVYMLKRQRERLAAELRAIVESHLRMLDNQDAQHQREDEERRHSAASFKSSTVVQEGKTIEHAQELTLALSSELATQLDDASNSSLNPSSLDSSLDVESSSTFSVSDGTNHPDLEQEIQSNSGNESGDFTTSAHSQSQDLDQSTDQSTESLPSENSLLSTLSSPSLSISPSDLPRPPSMNSSASESGLAKLQKVLSHTPSRVDRDELSTQAPNMIPPPQD